MTTSSRALIGYGTLRKRVTDLKKVENQNRKFILKVIGKPHYKMEAQVAGEHFFKVVSSLQSKRGGLLRSF